MYRLELESMNLNLSLPDDLIKRVEDFWHDNRFASRSEALRWLIQEALNKKLRPEKQVGEKAG